MKYIISLLIVFSCFNSQAQTMVDSMVYSFHYNDNCRSYVCNVSVPRIKWGYYEGVKFVNDTVFKIGKAFLDRALVECPIDPYYQFNESDTCSVELYKGAKEFRMSFQIFRITDSILSFRIEGHEIEGNGGHGSSVSIYDFNVDLVNNTLVTFDSLFDEHNYKKLLKMIEEKYTAEGGSMEDSGPYIDLLGFNISDTSFVMNYSEYMGHYLTNDYDIELPLADIKPLVRKEYQWMLR